MTIQDALKHGIKQLLPTAASRQDLAALDAEILLSSATGYTREKLLIHPETKLRAGQFKKFEKLIQRRGRREPIAYIIGKKGFFGLEFKVNPSVLIPRPETEMLVEETMREFQILTARRDPVCGTNSKFQILDIGTGSGAMAIALAKNLPKAKIMATDVSSSALKVARQNARRHGVEKRIKFIKTDLLPLTLSSKLLTLIVANLPYLPARVWSRAMPDVKKFEPQSALLGGTDGLDLIKKLLREISRLPFKSRKVVPIAIGTSSRQKQNLRGIILLEIDPSQKTKLLKFAKKLFPQATVETKKDLAGLFRIVKIILN